MTTATAVQAEVTSKTRRLEGGYEESEIVQSPKEIPQTKRQSPPQERLEKRSEMQQPKEMQQKREHQKYQQQQRNLSASPSSVPSPSPSNSSLSSMSTPPSHIHFPSSPLKGEEKETFSPDLRKLRWTGTKQNWPVKTKRVHFRVSAQDGQHLRQVS